MRSKKNSSQVIILAATALLLVVLSCLFSTPVVTQAQIDPTILARQSELAVTAEANAHATAARRREIEKLHDSETRTALDITVSAATAVYWSGQTQTPIAATATAQRYADQTATVQSIRATREYTETATAWAQVSAIAEARSTQSAQQTATVIAATATADAEAFAEQVRRQEELDRVTSENRQRIINQVRQAVYVLGGLALVVASNVVVYLLFRRFALTRHPEQAAAPEQAAGLVIDQGGGIVGDEGRPMTEAEIAAFVNRPDAPRPVVNTDSGIVRKMYERLKDTGAIDGGVVP